MRLVTPCEWPIGVAGHKTRLGGTYRADGNPISIPAAVQRLDRELDLLGATDAELSANFGRTRAGNVAQIAESGKHPGAVVRYDYGRKPYTLPCDTFATLAQNIAALAAHIEAVRKIERIGVATVAQSMGAFAQLPAPSKKREWWEVLGVSPNAPREVVDASYRALVKKRHPDVGGSHEAFVELTQAYEEAKAK